MGMNVVGEYYEGYMWKMWRCGVEMKEIDDWLSLNMISMSNDRILNEM